MANINIVLFPFMAQGHMIPFLELAKLLEQHRTSPIHSSSEISITFLSTPLNIQNLKYHLPPSSKILLQTLPFIPSNYNLPPGTENTQTCHSHVELLNLNLASRSLRSEFENFIIRHCLSNPQVKLCVIADVFLSWTIPICKKYSVSHVPFTTCGAFGTGAYMSMCLHLPHRKTEEEYFRVPGFPDSFKLHRTEISRFTASTDGTDEWYKFMFEEIKCCIQSTHMICNTVEGLEPLGLQALQSVTGVGTVYTVGSKDIVNRGAVRKYGIERNECIQWLDRHRNNSVLYISFGSQNSIGVSHMLALAEGLESSRVPFIWVIRPPLGTEHGRENDEDDHDIAQMQKWLPRGFIERMTRTNQGLLVWKWAPQLEILTHRATGAFLSHCGWNSTLESLSCGVPLVAWPLAAEQFYNVKMLEDQLRASVVLNRGTESELEREKVEIVVKEVMTRQRGMEMRENANVCKETIRNAMKEKDDGGNKGSSLRSLDELLGFFING